MRYFVLKQDERISDRPYHTDFFEKIDVRKVNARQAGYIPARTLIRLRPYAHTVFPEMLCDPVVLVTREMRDVIKAYDEYLSFRQIVYLDPENELTQLYFMPMLESIDCLSEKSEFVNEYRAEYAKVVLKKTPIRDSALFYVENGVRRLAVIRLDLAESLLNRNCRGFTLTEAATEKE